MSLNGLEYDYTNKSSRISTYVEAIIIAAIFKKLRQIVSSGRKHLFTAADSALLTYLTKYVIPVSFSCWNLLPMGGLATGIYCEMAFD